MTVATVHITPEYSALGPGKKPSPALSRAIAGLDCVRGELSLGPPRVVLEYGCGLLRNIPALDYPVVHAIDTDLQLSRQHTFGEYRGSLHGYVKEAFKGRNIRITTPDKFRARNVDVVFCINVLDVIPSSTRAKVLKHIAEILRPPSQLVLVVPRNDSRTLKLCTSANRFLDGYYFRNHGAYTFYRNWRKTEDLVTSLTEHRLRILADLSLYRHAILIAAAI